LILFNAWTFDDILVVIEVTDLSSRRKKAELYASEKVKDYWVLNIPERCIEVFREPRNSRCRSAKTYQSVRRGPLFGGARDRAVSL